MQNDSAFLLAFNHIARKACVWSFGCPSYLGFGARGRVVHLSGQPYTSKTKQTQTDTRTQKQTNKQTNQVMQLFLYEILSCPN